MAIDDKHSEFAKRIEKTHRAAGRAGLDALILAHPVNRFYLTGFPSTYGFVVIEPRRGATFYTDFRYIEMARRMIDAAPSRLLTDFSRQMDALARRGRWRNVGYEGAISSRQQSMLQRAMPSVEEWVESESLVLDQRVCKSRFEQAALRRAVALGDAVFRRTVEEIVPGMTEWEIRRVLRGWVDRLDAEGESFDCIISAGSNASKPHARPGERIWRPGQPLLIDMGIRLQNYCSDMTRMVFAGRPSAAIRKIYDIVLTAQRKAIDAVRAGRTAREIDAIARNHIIKKGYGARFGHGLGHGVGLDIHEAPTLNRLSDDVLRPGMVVTIEPGIYLPGVGGVRIEDVVIVRRDGCEVLTGTTKDMLFV